jgi:hypothetical protein
LGVYQWTIFDFKDRVEIFVNALTKKYFVNGSFGVMSDWYLIYFATVFKFLQEVMSKPSNLVAIV